MLCWTRSGSCALRKGAPRINFRVRHVDTAWFAAIAIVVRLAILRFSASLQTIRTQSYYLYARPLCQSSAASFLLLLEPTGWPFPTALKLVPNAATGDPVNVASLLTRLALHLKPRNAAVERDPLPLLDVRTEIKMHHAQETDTRLPLDVVCVQRAITVMPIMIADHPSHDTADRRTTTLPSAPT